MEASVVDRLTAYRFVRQPGAILMAIGPANKSFSALLRRGVEPQRCCAIYRPKDKGATSDLNFINSMWPNIAQHFRRDVEGAFLVHFNCMSHSFLSMPNL